MSATTTVADYERSTEARWDNDQMLWFCHVGVKNRSNALILQATFYGRTAMVAINRAEAWCTLMSALKPPKS